MSFTNPKFWHLDVSYDYKPHASANQKTEVIAGSTEPGPRFKLDNTSNLYNLLMTAPIYTEDVYTSGSSPSIMY
jgi:hypothetical protein